MPRPTAPWPPSGWPGCPRRSGSCPATTTWATQARPPSRPPPRGSPATSGISAPLWTEDRPGWRLIGLNSQVIGTGGDADRAQRTAIAEALATLGERRIAVFLHKPMLLDAIEEGPVGYWAVPPEARDAVRPLLGHRNLRLVASGHLHLWRLASHGPATLAWAPATSFTLGTRLMPEPRGAERQLGVMRHVFRADCVETEFLRIPGAEPLVLDDMVDEIYPPAPAAAS